MAVKQRSPGRPTLYAGYTNGAVGYFPTAAAYPEGGYEPAYSNRSYGRPAPVAPECERMLVETRRAARRVAVPGARALRRRRLDGEPTPCPSCPRPLERPARATTRRRAPPGIPIPPRKEPANEGRHLRRRPARRSRRASCSGTGRRRARPVRPGRARRGAALRSGGRGHRHDLVPRRGRARHPRWPSSPARA